jgi:hypothetical protein
MCDNLLGRAQQGIQGRFGIGFVRHDWHPFIRAISARRKNRELTLRLTSVWEELAEAVQTQQFSCADNLVLLA